MNTAQAFTDERCTKSVAYADATGRVLSKEGPHSHWLTVGEHLLDSNVALIGQDEAFDALKQDPSSFFTLTDISFSALDQSRFYTITVKWLPERQHFHVETTSLEVAQINSFRATQHARATNYTAEQVAQEREHFRHIYEQSPQLAICIARDGSVVAASHLLRDRFLTPRCQDSETALTSVLTRGKLWQALWQGSGLSGMPIRAIDHHGRTCDLEVSGIAAQHPSELREEAYFTLMDITERNASRIELMDRSFELEQLSQRLQDSNKKLDQFASVAAHDLLAPLRRIAAFADMLHEELDGIQGDTVTFALDAIRRSAHNGQKLVDDILQLSRLSTLDARIDEIALNGVFAEVASEFDYKLAEIQGEVECISGDIPVIGDTRLVKLIFRNLINNAIKYRQSNRNLRITLSQSTTGGTPHARIELADNGIGMAPEDAQTVFAPFVRLCENNQVQGHGLGLAIVQEAAIAMGWHVFAHAEPKNGTRMVLTAPTPNPH